MCIRVKNFGEWYEKKKKKWSLNEFFEKKIKIEIYLYFTKLVDEKRKLKNVYQNLLPTKLVTNKFWNNVFFFYFTKLVNEKKNVISKFVVYNNAIEVWICFL